MKPNLFKKNDIYKKFIYKSNTLNNLKGWYVIKH